MGRHGQAVREMENPVTTGVSCTRRDRPLRLPRIHLSVPRISFRTGSGPAPEADPKRSVSRNHTSGRRDDISAGHGSAAANFRP